MLLVFLTLFLAIYNTFASLVCFIILLKNNTFSLKMRRKIIEMERTHNLYNFFSFIFISWRLITLQYCSGFCHTLTWITHGVSWRIMTLQYCSGFCHTLIWISHGFTCVPHSEPPSPTSLWVIPVHQPWAACLMHWTWIVDLFHTW